MAPTPNPYQIITVLSFSVLTYPAMLVSLPRVNRNSVERKFFRLKREIEQMGGAVWMRAGADRPWRSGQVILGD